MRTLSLHLDSRKYWTHARLGRRENGGAGQKNRSKKGSKHEGVRRILANDVAAVTAWHGMDLGRWTRLFFVGSDFFLVHLHAFFVRLAGGLMYCPLDGYILGMMDLDGDG